MEEISGVAFIFNQKFFQDLKQETGESENTCDSQTFTGRFSVQFCKKIWLYTVTAMVELRKWGPLLSVGINYIIHRSVLLLLLVFISKIIYVSPLETLSMDTDLVYTCYD